MDSSKKVYNSIIETIGDTPMVKLNKIAEDIPAQVLAKVEYFNPGHSTKDRMALKMIEDAEKEGKLKPGGTIIECTSGNTGMGLALAACVKGYRLICTLSDKQSKEKMDILRAMGAEIYVCPTNVSPDHPESYYSVAERLNKEIPNSFYPFQYDNLSNREAHYESTGPEIWEQTEGKITHFVVGVGTGGTISGVAKYLKEKNPNIKIWGVDSYGSVFKKYHETGEFDENEIYSYITEGIGEDILPKNVDFSLIDHFEKVTDRDGALVARELAKKEGLLLGYSCGSAFAAVRQLKDQLTKDDVVVVLFHDHGSRYVGKIFNDDWMRERGFISHDDISCKSYLMNRTSENMVTVKTEELVQHAIDKMKDAQVSQLPVMKDEQPVGSLDNAQLFELITDNAEVKNQRIEEVMKAPFPVVDAETSLQEVSKLMSKNNSAVLVNFNSKLHIITKHDILSILS